MFAGALVPGVLLGQDFHRSNITIGVGAAVPVGSASNYLTTGPLFTLGYGYRFNRLFQADAGVNIAFGAANNQGAVFTDLGPMQGGDHEFMIPLGGRIYIPQPFERIEVSAGGGAAYLHYSETAPSNPYYSSYCYSCTSRGGWGGYGLGSVRYFLDDNHNFTVGTTVQFIAGSTNGQPVGDVPAIRTTDHWLNVSFEFGVNF
jgi:hypothetical protein